MRIIFMGTPDFAVPTLDALIDAGHEVVAVYSQPPRRAGRGKAERPTPVHARADALGLVVRTPVTLRAADEQQAFAALGADAAVVAAYGLILPPPVLAAPLHGCLNVHASLLPRWRGAAPIQRAIVAGDEETGVTIMQMEAGLDTGPMRRIGRAPVAGRTAGELTDALAHLGARIMVEVLADLTAYPPVVQPEDGVSYAAKIDKAESRIDPSLPAIAVERRIRAFNPAPGAWIAVGGERIKILAASIESGSGAPGTMIDDRMLIACADGAVRPTLVQRQGKGAMATAELLRGFPVPAGTRIDL